jgi:hypothetical protein
MSKHEKLGMNPSTAAHRLRVDLLFDLAVKAGHVCFRCGLSLTRETFSIEHKEAWQSAADPKAAFFDLGNIAYSHLACNTAASIRSNKVHASPEARRIAYKPIKAARMRDAYHAEDRHAKYYRTGH